MLTKKTFAAVVSLALAGTMAVPAFAAEAIPVGQAGLDARPLISEYTPASPVSLALAEDENPLTRSEAVSVLYEKEGKPGVNFAMNYTDVAPEADYAEAVRWASSQGIAGGYGDGTFGPDDTVTREQLAVILYRYAQSKDQGFTGAWAFPLPYADAQAVSGFAYEAVCWVTMKGVMGDAGENQFAPASGVTHSDAKLMFQQYFDAVNPVEIPNPFLDFETMSDAAQIAGFSMELPDGMEPCEIRAVEGSMLEVVCQSGWGAITLRKGIGTQDISGDYSHYAQTSTEELDGCTVTLKGNNGNVMVAVWNNGSYAYAVRAEAGLEMDTMLSIVSNVK